MEVPKSQAEWLQRHTEMGPDDIPRCKESKSKIKIRIIGRSIWIRPILGGSGKVRRIAHLYCPVCTPDPEFPRYGTPIFEDELIEDPHKIVYKNQPAL